MEGESYRLSSVSLAIRTYRGDRCTITIPASETVTLVNGPIGTKRFVEVDWKGESLLMFAGDLQHSDTSFCLRSTHNKRGGECPPADSQWREQALIEHSIKLAEGYEELERLSFAAAHDLRDPLCSIQFMAELFLQRNRRKLDKESAHMLDLIVSGAERMKVLIEDLLEFAIASHQAERTQVDSGAVVALAAQNLSQAIEQSGARITIELLPEVHANSDQLVRLFQNLISNAIKYRSENTPVIHISASAKAEEWTFTVSDNGVGIDPKYHHQIFAAFRRLQRKSDNHGSGVGLAICKRIVEQYGGRIWVKSEPEKGSKFSFTIPAFTDSLSDGRGVSHKPTLRSDKRSGKTRAAGR